MTDVNKLTEILKNWSLTCVQHADMAARLSTGMQDLLMRACFPSTCHRQVPLELDGILHEAAATAA